MSASAARPRDELAVETTFCTTCQAEAGARCSAPDGRTPKRPHANRRTAYNLRTTS